MEFRDFMETDEEFELFVSGFQEWSGSQSIEAKKRLLRDVWCRCSRRQRDLILQEVCRADQVDLFWLLVSMGMSLTDEKDTGDLPVNTAIMMRAIKILWSCVGHYPYERIVSSTRRLTEAMHAGCEELVSALLYLGAPMMESHAKYGPCLGRCLSVGLQKWDMRYMFYVYQEYDRKQVEEHLVLAFGATMEVVERWNRVGNVQRRSCLLGLLK